MNYIDVRTNQKKDQMKAVEWSEKFQATTSPEELSLVLDEYGKETADLIALRSKTSVDKSRLSAMDGAVAEQRNKFRAIKAPGVTPELFEPLLDKFAKDYVNLKAKSLVKPAETTPDARPVDGRKLTDRVNTFKPRNQQRPSPK